MKRELVCLGVLVLGGCSPISQEAKQELAKPVDCRTATGDIRLLRSEKASVLKEIGLGVGSITPAGFVVGVASGNEGADLKVATGDYNRMIDNKISDIQSQCGVS